MAEEFLNPTTSNEELMERYRENKNQGINTDGGFCEGNISYECVQDSLLEATELLDGRSDYVFLGGVPTQVVVASVHGESDYMMREFGDRTTSDLDVLSNNPAEVKRELRPYDEGELLDLDVVDPSVFNGNAEEVISSAMEVNPESYNIGTEVRVPGVTDQIYTKIHDEPSRQKAGTSHDARILKREFGYDNQRMRHLLGGNEEAWSYLERL